MTKKLLVNRKKVFLFAPFKSSFIDMDYSILREIAEVKRDISYNFKALLSIFNNLLTHDIIYCWFGSVYAGFAAGLAFIFKKKCIIVIGGVDAVAVPSFNYGIWLTPWKAHWLKWMLPLADSLLVVAPNLKENLKKFINYDGKNIYYLPTCYDTEYWKPAGEKENWILSIGICDSIKKIQKKGFDTLIKTAYLLPEYTFKIIGVKKELVDSIKYPANVEFIPDIPQKDLMPYYQKAKVFCQPSRSEGMPNTLCEAMACGCIPVGSDVDGIPTAIGDTGYLVPMEDHQAFGKAIVQALKDGPENGMAARQRIIDMFPLTRRKNALQNLILKNEPPR